MLQNAEKTYQTRKRERGAALVTVLMISTLLVATGGTLILITGMATKNAVDSTAEMQAYYAAEAGIQDTLNVLRGNVAHNPGLPAGTKINFRSAMTASECNLPSDDSTDARLSGWLNYDYMSVGATDPDRVSLTPGYSPLTGLAYSVVVTDPDNTPVAAGEPIRLLLRVTGYGPKGALKKLEVLVKRNNFDYNPPAMLLMRGADDCSALTLTFTAGDSAAKEYTGHDRVSSSILPSFGATCNSDRDIELAADTKDTVEDPKAETFTNSSLPSWLQTADEARAFLSEQKANAINQFRYFTSFDGTAGSVASPEFTFVDGDCVLDGGAGLMIVTGTLTFEGNDDFHGLILVLGGGNTQRSGAGNGTILGAMAVAKFDINGTGGFLAPTFQTSGSGTGDMNYDSNAIRAALNLAGPRALGVHEF